MLIKKNILSFSPKEPKSLRGLTFMPKNNKICSYKYFLVVFIITLNYFKKGVALMIKRNSLKIIKNQKSHSKACKNCFNKNELNIPPEATPLSSGFGLSTSKKIATRFAMNKTAHSSKLYRKGYALKTNTHSNIQAARKRIRLSEQEHASLNKFDNYSIEELLDMAELEFCD
jgi:hypothetical protein